MKTPAPDTFDALLARAAAGDEDALADLLRRAEPALRRAVSADLPRRWQHLLTPEDVLQQTWVDAFCAIAEFAGRDQRAWQAWLTRIAKRNLLDAARMLDAEKRGGRRPPASLDRDSASHTLFARLARWTTPSMTLSRGEAADTLRSALADLPDDYRLVVEQYDLLGRPMADIAARLHRSEGAAFMLRARALRVLRQRLGGTSGFFPTRA